MLDNPCARRVRGWRTRAGRGARRSGEQLIVSSIYDWYIADFGGDEAGIVDHLRRFADPPLLKMLEDPGPLAASYDWALNER